MTQARASLVSLSDTPWYHVVNRCVRRAYLCGVDSVSGKSFEHRRGWIAERIQQLASVFAVDVAAYAVMSNHYHIVLRIDRDRALSWDRDEVLRRWTQLFSGSSWVQRHLAGDADAEAATAGKLDEWAETYRARLYDLSWFMRVLNETIAREANKEDGVKGHFWEGRFKSQALLDEQALLSAMAYVDLNPIRAGLAETPEASDFTSLQQRLRGMAAGNTDPMVAAPFVPAAEAAFTPPPEPQAYPDLPPLHPENILAKLPGAPLSPFDATGRFEAAIPFGFEDYVELVEITGRAVHPHKRGHIPDKTPRLLDRLGINPEAFIEHASHLLKRFGHAVGAPARLTERCAAHQTRYLRGMRMARKVFEQKAV